jgi:hypothetical protein
MLIFSWFSSVCSVNASIISYIRPRPLPSISFPVHYSLIIVSSDVIHPELLTATLNKSQKRYLCLKYIVEKALLNNTNVSRTSVCTQVDVALSLR